MIDDEICQAARRIARGIDMGDGPLATDLFGDLSDGEIFLTSEATLRRAQEEAQQPPGIIDRDRRDRWQQLGGETMEERARRRVERLLSLHEPTPLPDETHRALRSIMEREARAHGLDHLPDDAP